MVKGFLIFIDVHIYLIYIYVTIIYFIILIFLDEGISSYTSQPEKAGHMITKCIEDVVLKTLPHRDVKKTPIYLGATAGMRLLWYALFLLCCNTVI